MTTMIRDPILDAGTPEEEAMRYRALPLFVQYHRWDNFKNLCATKYHYYNHPEGEDLLGKLIHFNSLVFKPALFLGLYNSIMVKQEKTMFLRTVRTLHFVVPAMGCATAFVTGAYAANKIRGKDDFANWMVGTLAAGSVVGKWLQSGLSGWNAFLLFTIAAGVQRIAHNEGFKLFHELENRNYMDIKDAESVRWHKVSRGNWEIYTDVEKGYTTTH